MSKPRTVGDGLDAALQARHDEIERWRKDANLLCDRAVAMLFDLQAARGVAAAGVVVGDPDEEIATKAGLVEAVAKEGVRIYPDTLTRWRRLDAKLPDTHGRYTRADLVAIVNALRAKRQTDPVRAMRRVMLSLLGLNPDFGGAVVLAESAGGRQLGSRPAGRRQVASGGGEGVDGAGAGGSVLPAVTHRSKRAR
jgi:hypothetical protein